MNREEGVAGREEIKVGTDFFFLATIPKGAFERGQGMDKDPAEIGVTFRGRWSPC